MRVRLVLGLTLALGLHAAAAEAGFNCSASAARIGVLGKTALEPVTANAGGTDCTAENKTLSGAATGLPAPVSAGALVAATEVYSTEKGVLASGGLADLRVLSLPTLPLTLPPVTVPDALKTLTVSLAAVKAAIPVLPDPLNTGIPNAVRDSIPASVTVDASAAVQTLLPDGKLPTAELLRIRGAMAYAAGVCRSGVPTLENSAQVVGISVLGPGPARQ